MFIVHFKINVKQTIKNLLYILKIMTKLYIPQRDKVNYLKFKMIAEENELDRRAEKHRKSIKKGSRGWFVNFNGNPGAGVNAFNHATSFNTGDGGMSIGEAVEDDSTEIKRKPIDIFLMGEIEKSTGEDKDFSTFSHDDLAGYFKSIAKDSDLAEDFSDSSDYSRFTEESSYRGYSILTDPDTGESIVINEDSTPIVFNNDMDVTEYIDDLYEMGEYDEY